MLAYVTHREGDPGRLGWWRGIAVVGLVAIVAGLVLTVASAGTITGRGSGRPVKAKGLTPKERKALRIVSVRVTGVEPLGVLVTATFAGNIEQALGRGHLSDAIVALILRPKDPRLAFSGVATFGAGAIGRTARKTRSRDVGVVRNGRKVTFFVGGPGFENVAKIEVKAFAKAPSLKAVRRVQADKPRQDVSPELWEQIGKSIGALEASVPAPSAATSCDELGDVKTLLAALLKRAREWETTLSKAKQIIEKAIPELERDLADKQFQRAGAIALSLGNVIATGALALVPPLAVGTASAAVGLSKAGRTLSEQVQALRDYIRSLKLDLRLIDAYLDKVRTLSANIRELQGKVDAFLELKCKRPVLTSIRAVFDQETFSTIYTENATGTDLNYTWSVSIPVDPDCAAGFNGNSPKANQATWFHKDKSQGGSCNHDGTRTGPRGHPGTVTVVVSNMGWTCKATYEGTQGDGGKATGDGPAPEACVSR
jgi:hypothetical protein